jgi:Zn-dependent protease with chaperone function
MASPSNASRAFVALLALGVASLALLGALLWQQGVQLAQGVWLACQSAAQAVEGYLPLAGLLLPLALFLASGLRGLGMLTAQLWFTHWLMRSLNRRRLSLSVSLATLAGALQLTGRLTVVDDTEAYAFVAGLARPHIWLSSGLLSLLDEAELAAVLCHERHHLLRRDPLRVLLARSLAHGLFFLPVAAALRDCYMEAKEREADLASGASHELAAALLKLVRAGSHLPTGASLAAAGSSVTAGRIGRLLGSEPAGQAFDQAMIRRLAASLALALALLTTNIASMSQAASPLVGGECGYTTWPAVEQRYTTPATFTPHSLTPGP